MGIEKGRFGQFFLFIGIISLIIFFSWGQEAQAPFLLLLAGGALMIVGGVLIWKDWKPGPESGRFRMIRNMRRKKDQKRNQKENRREDGKERK